MSNVKTSDRFRNTQSLLRQRNQDHLLRWWPELTEDQREQLLADIDAIPWTQLEPVIASTVVNDARPASVAGPEPASIYRRDDSKNKQTSKQAVERGRELLRAGMVAAFTVAGGQGTRLGFPGPKGMFPATPVGDHTLFECFAHMVLAASRKYQATIPWYIMTSDANHDETVEYFRRHDYFGLPSSDVHLFQQGMLPAFDRSGRILLSEKYRVAMSPDGHGGSLKALATSGALDDMHRRGISVISYFQVDNPLVKPFDPLFLGLHDLTGSEMSTKVTPKADDLERVGNVCLVNGKVHVIEYSELPEALARARNPDGSRRFDAGNLAIHLLDPRFVKRITGESHFQLPLRRAEKKVPFIDESGNHVDPTKPNAIKLEMFVFDALPLASNPLILEVDRREEFSPIKNATGTDSVDTSQHDQVLRACRWLEAAGMAVPRRGDGSPDCTIAISPLFALDAEDIPEKRDRVPSIARGIRVYLE